MKKTPISLRFVLVIVLTVLAQHGKAQVQNQYPSPMVHYTRTHERVSVDSLEGKRFQFKGLLPGEVGLYQTEQVDTADSIKLFIHFHGEAYVPIYAVENSNKAFLLVNINLGSGSSAYEKPFIKNHSFKEIISIIHDSLQQITDSKKYIKEIYLAAFSAGYGAVRAILRQEAAFNLIDGVILLDGLHTDYIAESQVLAHGGSLNVEKLPVFLKLARAAVEKEKIFLVTHSEIFPGTYASTTETADYLLKALGLKRKPALKWGVLGMQQISEAREGNFIVMGFAGNTAPDHIDHSHALFDFIKYLD